MKYRKNVKIAVIVPTYEEEEIIDKFIIKLKKSLRNKNFRLILVDDSPNMLTVKKARLIADELDVDISIHHRTKKFGKGSAVADGLKMVNKEDVIVIIDADLEYDPKEIIPMMEKLKEADIIVSVRKRKDIFYRQILAFGFKILTAVLFNLNFDTQSGLKVLKKGVGKKLKIETKGWAWDVEFLYKIKKKGYKILLHQIIFKPRKYGHSKIHPFSSSIKMFINLFKLFINLRLENFIQRNFKYNKNKCKLLK